MSGQRSAGITMAPSPIGWIGAGLTHQGEVRDSNQDALAIDNEQGLWIVADGMGGYAGGQIASALAVSSIPEYLRTRSTPDTLHTDQRVQPATILTQAVAAAKAAIQDRITTEPDLGSMGTTVVTAWFQSDPQPSMVIAHVGDSRAYLIRNSQLVALTRDHSLVQQLLDKGEITVEEAWDHPKRNVIVRALGSRFPSTPDTAVHTLEPDDRILLCTDGVTKMLTDHQILATILEYQQHPEEACRHLIDRANTAGGFDNITVLFITPHISKLPPAGIQ